MRVPSGIVPTAGDLDVGEVIAVGIGPQRINDILTRVGSAGGKRRMRPGTLKITVITVRQYRQAARLIMAVRIAVRVIEIAVWIIPTRGRILLVDQAIGQLHRAPSRGKAHLIRGLIGKGRHHVANGGRRLVNDQRTATGGGRTGGIVSHQAVTAIGGGIRQLEIAQSERGADGARNIGAVFLPLITGGPTEGRIENQGIAHHVFRRQRRNILGQRGNIRRGFAFDQDLGITFIVVFRRRPHQVKIDLHRGDVLYEHSRGGHQDGAGGRLRVIRIVWVVIHRDQGVENRGRGHGGIEHLVFLLVPRIITPATVNLNVCEIITIGGRRQIQRIRHGLASWRHPAGAQRLIGTHARPIREITGIPIAQDRRIRIGLAFTKIASARGKGARTAAVLISQNQVVVRVDGPGGNEIGKAAFPAQSALAGIVHDDVIDRGGEVAHHQRGG